MTGGSTSCQDLILSGSAFVSSHAPSRAKSLVYPISDRHSILPRQTRVRHAVREVRVPLAVRDLAVARAVVVRALDRPFRLGFVLVEQRPEDVEAPQAAEALVVAQRLDDGVVEVADVGAVGVEVEEVSVGVVGGPGVDGEGQVGEVEILGQEGHDGAPGAEAAVVGPRPVDDVRGRHLEVDLADQGQHCG